MVLTIKSAGAAVLPAYAVNTTAEALLMNGCDKFDVKKEILVKRFYHLQQAMLEL